MRQATIPTSRLVGNGMLISLPSRDYARYLRRLLNGKQYMIPMHHEGSIRRVVVSGSLPKGGNRLSCAATGAGLPNDLAAG